MASEDAHTDAVNADDGASGTAQVVNTRGSSSTSTNAGQPLMQVAHGVPAVSAIISRPHVIPVEMLSAIFACLPFAELVRVSHVSRWWRQVAINYGVLWTDIRSRSRIPFAFAEQMRRSKKAYITVHVQLRTDSLGSAMLLIQQNLDRIRSLNISYKPQPPAITLTEANVASILAHLDSAAPVLSDLVVDVTGLAGEVDVPVDLFARFAPRLRRADLNGLNSLPTQCDAFSNLTEYATILNYHDEPGPGLAALGTLSPSLFYLQLGLAGNDVILPPTPCTVQLTVLDLFNTSPQFCLPLLHYFMNPASQTASGFGHRRLSRFEGPDFPGWFSAFWGDEVLVTTTLQINADASGPDSALRVRCRLDYNYQEYESCIDDVSNARLIGEPGLCSRTRHLLLGETVFWTLDHPLPVLPVLDSLVIMLMAPSDHMLAPAPDSTDPRVYLGNVIEDPCSILHYPCTAPRATLVCPALRELTLSASRSHDGRAHCTADPGDVLAFIRTHLACDHGELSLQLQAVDIQLSSRVLEVYELWTSVAKLRMWTREEVEEQDHLEYESEPSISSRPVSRTGSVSVHVSEDNDNE